MDEVFRESIEVTSRANTTEEISVISEMDCIERVLEDQENLIEEQLLQKYHNVFRKLKNAMVESEVLDFYGIEIEEEIYKMCLFFVNAIERRNCDTANQICAAIVECVSYLQKYQLFNGQTRKNDENRKFKERLHRMTLLLRFQDFSDDLSNRIESMEESEKQLSEEIELVQTQLLEMPEDAEHYKKKIYAIQSGKEKLTQEVAVYVRSVNNLARIQNSYARSLLLKHKLIDRNQRLKDVIETINLIVFGTVDILGYDTLDDLENAMDQFEENMKAQQKENQKLKQMNDKFTSVISDSATELDAKEDYKDLLHMAEIASLLKSND